MKEEISKQAFSLWSEERRPEMKKHDRKLNAKALSEALCAEWGRMDDTHREPWINRAMSE